MMDQQPNLFNRSTRWGAWVAIAITIVSAFEGFSGKKYYDSVHVATICFGATAADHVDLTKVYTKAQCQTMLGTDLPKYDAPLKKCLKPAVYNALPPHRHAALVSLAYNVGDAAVCRSSVVRYLNAGNVPAACQSFMLYDRAGGRVLPGLRSRREQERALCRMDN